MTNSLNTLREEIVACRALDADNPRWNRVIVPVAPRQGKAHGEGG